LAVEGMMTPMHARKRRQDETLLASVEKRCSLCLSPPKKKHIPEGPGEGGMRNGG
jgi:hypothetical protein